MKIQESGENYLETILMLRNRQGNVRSIDLAVELNYSKPSISRAVGLLKKAGYLTVDENGYIELTAAGLEKANSVYEKHKIIRFTTDKEDSEYEIMSAFKSRLYYKTEKNVFRYYQFINPKSEKEYSIAVV